MNAALVGTLAAACSVTAFLPQVLRIIKTRRTDDLSTAMWILQVTAFALWVGYGAALGELPIVIPNAICAVLAAFILAMKLLPRKQRDRIADAVEHALPPTITSGRSS